MELVKRAVPKSISHWLDPFIIVAIIAVVYASLRESAMGNLLLSIIIIATIAIVMGLIEFFRAPWSPLNTFGRPAAPARSIYTVLSETALQWLGMLLYFLFIVSCWWLLAEYSRAYYEPFFLVLPYVMVVGPIVTALVLFASEYFCGSVLRGGRELGLMVSRLCTGKHRTAFANARWNLIRDELLSWLLFGFFLPINFVELVKALGIFRGQEMLIFGDDWIKAQYLIIMMIYAALIAAITPGYLFAARLIRTETRAVDHSWFGWTITLICYDPIVTAVFGRWLDYRTAVEGASYARPWAAVFENAPSMLLLIGGTIIFMELIHLWGEAQFGLRASNISNRGVITTGLFRLTKHPIYVSKCAGWLLIWLPFMAGGNATENLRLTIIWGIVCVIYALRALAEEKLMAKDPDYVTYALYMDERGMFAWVGKLIPFMSFKYRLKKWRETDGTFIELPDGALAKV